MNKEIVKAMNRKEKKKTRFFRNGGRRIDTS